MQPLLEVKDLWTQFTRPGGTVYAVNGVSFTLQPGEAMGIVGESGSGKSVLLLSILGLIARNGQVTGGEARLSGTDLVKLAPSELRKVRGRDVGVIFQDPMTSLNPIMRVGEQIMEGIVDHGLCGREEAKKRAIELLRKVGIPKPEERFYDYPFQFSGGMRQRVMIAIALACEPKLLIADEPTTALDVTVQAQVLELIRRLTREMGMGLIIITHDLGVATNYCDKIAVMYSGEIVEMAPVEQFITGAAHPYSLGLLGSTLEIGHGKAAIEPIPGQSASAMTLYMHCPFAPRCKHATERCWEERPKLRAMADGHQAACHHAEEVFARVAR